MGHVLEAFQAPEWGMVFHGEESMHSFIEARVAYIHGLDLATVLLSLACIERELLGRLYMVGWGKAKRAGLKKIISEAHERGILSDAESDTFQHLRCVRNSYAHFKPPLHSSSLMSRALDQDLPTNEVMMIDARRAIETLGGFFKKRPGPF